MVAVIDLLHTVLKFVSLVSSVQLPITQAGLSFQISKGLIHIQSCTNLIRDCFQIHRSIGLEGTS